MHNEFILGNALEDLLSFAVEKHLISSDDVFFCRNALLALLGLQTPPACSAGVRELPETATPLLSALFAGALEEGVIPEDLPVYREMFDAKIMGALLPMPGEIRRRFRTLESDVGSLAATQWFYDLCRSSNYIRVDDIARNIRYFAETDVGELEITINLTKPEKTPAQIKLERETPSLGYPKCMLCPENEGYAGRVNHPARQNLRTIPIKLCGEDWLFQYSPYAYYNEHCIVFSQEHIPMTPSEKVYARLLDFVDRFPHYFLGANAGLPIVGGSILSHDHFQGGRYEFPMNRAGTSIALAFDGLSELECSVADWPMPCIRLAGSKKDVLKAAYATFCAWENHDDEACGIRSRTGETPHNAITAIARREGTKACLDLVLRNNRTTLEHPSGLFHPHEELHHIKQENIGLIEVMGCFILPGRLKDELAAAERELASSDASLSRAFTDTAALEKHASWVLDLKASHPGVSAAEANAIVRSAVAAKCAHVLNDAGVYKRTPDGREGLLRFLVKAGYTEA